jgi:glyoxylase I family protein
VTEKFYCDHFNFKRARVAKLPDGNQIVFIKMADSGFYLQLFKASKENSLPPATNDGYTFPGVRHLALSARALPTKKTCRRWKRRLT